MRMKIFAAVFVVMSLAYSASAETITLGALSVPTVTEPVDITFSGANFSFNGVASPWCGVFTPLLSEFRAGNVVSLAARWTGTDLAGEATTAGQTYGVGSLLANTEMDASWSGILSLPSEFAGGRLSSPFSFTGTFRFDGGAVDLAGRGMAVADFLRKDNGSFHLAALNYTFGETTPNPEPGTVVLLVSGFGLLVYRRSARGVRPVPMGGAGGYGNWTARLTGSFTALRRVTEAR